VRTTPTPTATTTPVTTPVTNTSGFLVNPADVTDPEEASLAGLSLLDEYLLSVRVGDVFVSWPVLQRPFFSIKSLNTGICVRDHAPMLPG
jgi:hypothetical protein